MREHETLMFDLTNDDLAYAICLLKDRHPEVICRRAWEIITTEQERRYATKGFVKFLIDIPASAYAELPAEVAYRKRPPLTMPEGPL